MHSTPNNWIGILPKLGFKRKKQTKRRNTNHFSRRLCMESLEDRRLLAITVNTFVDELDGNITTDGDVSLRDAILLAPAGETINFSTDPADGLNGSTITLQLSLEEIDIIQSVTIDASMLSSGITIDAGNGTDNIFNTGDGIRIFNITDSTGGTNPPLVTMVGLTLTGADVPGDFSKGGAIRSEALLVIRDSFILNNGAGVGGGLFVQVAGSGSRDVLTIDNSTIDGNKARGAIPGIEGSSGGGIAVVSGALNAPTNDTILITNNTIISNNATSPEGGGGVFAQLYGASLTIDGNSLLTQNHAHSDDGGGIYAALDQGASITLSGISLDLNHAGGENGGGGAYILLNGTILPGGASGASTATIVQTTFYQNAADAVATNNALHGGGAYLKIRGGSTATMDQVTFDENKAQDGNGGGLYADVQSSTSTPRSTLRIENNTLFKNNNAFRNLGNLSGSGGAIYTKQGSFSTSTVEIMDSKFEMNHSDGDGTSLTGGGAIFANFGRDADALFAISDSEITGNTATIGGGVFTDMNFISAIGSVLR